MKTTLSPEVIGIDLGDKKHAICATDRITGDIVDERNITNHRESIRRLSQKFPQALIAMEIGSHSPWISRFLESLGHEVLVANPRKLRAIFQNDRKCDLYDARMLAKLARLDPSLLYPIKHQTEQAQRDLLQIKLRDSLVRRRVDLISAVRFTLKSLGLSLKSPNTNYFAIHTRRDMAASNAETLALIEPTLTVLDVITKQIKELDREIELLANTRYPETLLLRQINGVGVITALTFVLLAGDIDKQLRISRKGNSYMRSLLVGSAQYILGPFGTDCDLRTQGLKLAERGGPRAKKKAVIAIARKLAVVMLTLLKKECAYQPLLKTA